jgi:hypothetical protein
VIASTGQDPATDDGTYWLAVDQTPIGTVLPEGITTNHPQVSQYPYHWPFVVKTDRITCTDSNTPTTVWVQFRKRTPQLEGKRWDETLAYVAGDVRYRETVGDAYECATAGTNQDPATDTTAQYWRKIEIPAWLRGFLINGAAADGLKSPDRDDPVGLWSRAEKALMDASLAELEGQGHVMRATMRTE